MISSQTHANVVYGRIIHRTDTIREQYGWYTIAVLPILIHMWMVGRLAVNVPYIDDYTFLMDCLNRQLESIPLAVYLERLFHPHGEHIILFARLTVLFDYWIEGTLNFRTLFFVGNVTFIGSVWILFRLARRGGLQPVHLLPVVLFLFQPQSYENTMTWAICALQHLPALFFAFLAYDLLSRSSRGAFLASLPVAFLSAFSNGNGLIVLAVGLLILIALGSRRRVLIWLGLTVLSVGLYSYIHITNHSPAIGCNLMHPVRVFSGFFLLVGSIGLVTTRSLLILSALGVGMVAFMLLIISKNLTRSANAGKYLVYWPTRVRQVLNRWSVVTVNRPFLILTACYLYVLITLFAVSFARSNGWYQGLLVPRYIWFSTVALAVGYLLALLWLKPVYRWRLSRIFIVISLLANGLSYWFALGEVITVRQSLLSDTHNWRENKTLSSLPANSREHDRFYSDILQVATQKGIYKLPESPLDLIPDQVDMWQALSKPVVKDSSFALGDRQIHCLTLGGGWLKPQVLDSREVYVLLRSDQHTFMWPFDRSATKLAQYVLTGITDWRSDRAWVFDDQLPPATYQLGFAWSENGHWTIAPGSQMLKMGDSRANH